MRPAPPRSPRARLWSRGDLFWAVDFDELDVPWLVRYRIEAGRP
jgi:hypothetical protein